MTRWTSVRARELVKLEEMIVLGKVLVLSWTVHCIREWADSSVPAARSIAWAAFSVALQVLAWRTMHHPRWKAISTAVEVSDVDPRMERRRMFRRVTKGSWSLSRTVTLPE